MHYNTDGAWTTAHDAADMVLMAGNAGVPRAALVRATCACVRFGWATTRTPPAPRAAAIVAAAEAWAHGGRAAAEAWATTRGVALSFAATPDSLALSTAGAVARAVHVELGFAAHAAVRSAALAAVDAIYYGAWDHLPSSLHGTVLREVLRRMAALAREHIPWSVLAAAHARRA